MPPLLLLAASAAPRSMPACLGRRAFRLERRMLAAATSLHRAVASFRAALSYMVESTSVAFRFPTMVASSHREGCSTANVAIVSCSA